MKRDKKYVKPKTFAKYLIIRSKEDEITGLSAQLAYFLLLSAFPLLIFAITLLGYLPISSDEVLDLFNNIMHIAPEDTYKMIEEMIVSVFEVKRGDVLSISIIITLWTASNGMKAIIRALNKAYNIKESRGFFHNRLIALLMIFAIIIAIAVALILSVFGNLIGNFLFLYFELELSFLRIWDITRYIISFLLLLVLFALLYFIAPNKKLKWREIYIGTVFAAIGWIGVSWVFSFYVNNFGDYSATYGSLGGVVVLMVWLYISSAILILGGEINALIQYFKK